MELRLSVRVAAGALAVGCAGLLSADAAELREAGWWERAPLGLPASVPRDVPDGGLVVATDPSGGAAVAAVRFGMDPHERPLVLTLDIEQTRGATPAVVACPAGGPWTAAHGGAWDERPAADCDHGSVPGIISEDAEVISFVLDEVAIGTTVDLVLLPDQLAATDPATAADPSAFELVLSRPSVVAMETSRVQTGDDAPLPSAETGASAAPADRAGSPAGATVPPRAAGPADPASTPTTAAPPSRQRVPVDGLDTPAARQLPATPATEVALPSQATDGGDDTFPRLLAMVLVVLSLATAHRATSVRTTPRPLLDLGVRPRTSAADAHGAPELGVGRFRRPRSGRPPSIS